MKNLILGILLAGGMMFAASETAEAGHGRRRVRRSHHRHIHYTPIYRSYGHRHYRPRSYYRYGGHYGHGGHYGGYYGGYNRHIHVNFGHGGWGFHIH